MTELFYSSHFWISGFLIQRALGLLYLLAFINAYNQFRVLAGKDGLQPIDPFLEQVPFSKAPSLFHFYYSDRFLEWISLAGILLSLLVLLGITASDPLWASMLVLFMLWALYQSIVNVGQTFYGFGWESMLLELGFYGIFLGPLSYHIPITVIWMIRWMLFRVEFGAGLIKIRGDSCWRNLSCMKYHHETQPLPNPLSRFFHQLPERLHKSETLFNHFVQLVAVWGVFCPQPVSSVSALLLILSQLYLIVSGNYSWLNWMTVILGFSCFPDSFYMYFFTVSAPSGLAYPLSYEIAIYLLAALMLYLSIDPVKNLLSTGQLMNFSFNPLHLVNTYGAFGSVTKQRYEIVLEGTRDNPKDPQARWEEYEFKAKPGNPYRMPPQVAPYHLRLDWQMWFAAMTTYHRNPWLVRLIWKLLKNDRQALKLIKHNPFPEVPPRFIRARLYHYRYSTFRERKQTGRWWERTLAGEYMPPIASGQLPGFS